MAAKEIEVRCPCCEATLVVDVLTQKVLKHAPVGQVDETGKPVLDEGRWDAASAKVSKSLERGGDAFDAALSKEKSRSKDLDDLFDKAKNKVDKRGEQEL